MEIIKEEAFRKQMKKGLTGGYLFYGDEDYMKAHTLKSVCELICADPTFALFNHVHLDALDFSPAALEDALMPPPMMSEQKLVSVSGLSISAMKTNELEALCQVLAALPRFDYNVLILSIPSGQIEEGSYPKRPSPILTKLGEFLTPVLFESISGARLVTWVGKHFSFHGVTADPTVCAFLIEHAGKSMFTLASETEKLAYYVLANGRQQVTREDVLAVCPSVIATDAFALANAILDGRNEDALHALAVMKFQRTDPIIILSEISRVICDLITVKSLAEQGTSQKDIALILKMNEYKAKIYCNGAAGKSMTRLRRALAMCSEADLSLKLSAQGYIALEKLVCGL